MLTKFDLTIEDQRGVLIVTIVYLKNQPIVDPPNSTYVPLIRYKLSSYSKGVS